MRRIGLCLCIACLLMACGPAGKITSTNLARIYNKKADNLHPRYLVAHTADSSSTVFYELKATELLFKKKESAHQMYAKLKLSYNLYDSYESNVLIDSASFVLKETDREKIIKGDFIVKAKLKNNYLLEVIAKDLFRKKSTTTYVSIDKSSKRTRQYFLVKDAKTDEPIYQDFIQKNTPVTICYLPFREQDIKLVFGRHYHRDFPLAAPPFSMDVPQPFNYTADSLFVLELDDNGIATLTLPSHGIYHLQIDTTVKTGLTLYHFGDSYPKLHTVKELVPPLRYVTTRREYSSIMENEHPKSAIDDYWLNISSSKERAKELIKYYYNRVQDANRYFTSHMEGWRTDRGMIFVVFGAPNVIYKTTNSESWVFGEENNFMSVNFNFIKVRNPFTNNDFQLTRSPIYKGSYYSSVDGWREGRIYVNK